MTFNQCSIQRWQCDKKHLFNLFLFNTEEKDPLIMALHAIL